ncbi:hypothetical protein [Sporofaciens musculi]|uniref:hypothetical protein n=1 Tax=Sporofaciens musculi TaxID=2681861 RepID=UPI0025711CDD|nr:hypothetical protein [Sporofaciens musculi]
MSVLFETWTLQQELPEPFARLVRENGGKRTIINKGDCSAYNTGKAKAATLHPATLRAILWNLDLMESRISGAAGYQTGNDGINFYCMEYEKPDGRYAFIYNRKNGKIKGLRRQNDDAGPLPLASETESNGDEYLALFAYLSIIGTSPF